MPKKLFKKYLPSAEKIKQQKIINLFGSLLHDGNLWHLNRRSARGAFAVGLFWAWIPMPFQMLAAVGVAIPLRVNIPLTLALVWLSNPLTMPIMFYLSYLVGTVVLASPLEPFAFEPSLEWLRYSLHTIGKPFLLGSVLMAIAASISGYFLIDWLWRLSVKKAQLAKLLKKTRPGIRNKADTSD